VIPKEAEQSFRTMANSCPGDGEQLSERSDAVYKNISVSGSDQAECPIVEGLSQKQGRFLVLNRCFWRQKERFKQSSGKGMKNGEGMTVLEGYFLI
jgi:hypothetical protein